MSALVIWPYRESSPGYPKHREKFDIWAAGWEKATPKYFAIGWISVRANWRRWKKPGSFERIALSDQPMQSTHDTLELISSPGCEIGENPLWHWDMAKLFFVDIPAGTVYVYDPATHD